MVESLTTIPIVAINSNLLNIDISHLMNQLQKPNIPEYVYIMLIRVFNAIIGKIIKLSQFKVPTSHASQPLQRHFTKIILLC